MQIFLKNKLAVEIFKATSALNGQVTSWTRERMIKGEFDEEGYINIKLSDLNKKDLLELFKVCKEKNTPGKTLKTIQTWIDNMSNPHNAVVSSLVTLEKILIEAVKSFNPRWIMRMNPDGMMVPYAVEEIKYKGRSRDEDASVMLKMKCIKIYSDRWDDDEMSIKSQSKIIYFYTSDIKKIDTGEEIPFGRVVDDTDDDDDEDGPKKKKKKSPVAKGDYKLSEILAKNDLMLFTEDHFLEYQKHLTAYNSISKQIGSLYTSQAIGYIIEDKKRGYSRWKNLNDEDKIAKLVIDSISEKESSDSISTMNFGQVDVPIHPYVHTYNLTAYSYAEVHVANLVKYEFNENIIEKLVISDQKKKLLSALISTKNSFSDIISGKSGGIIILCSGEAGLGKTLTAEIYSELMKKPLYSIQSSQLGISVDDIEKNLNTILYRADKWNAVLLIDEADSYVYKRGNDILQNCIVGTFLRLLEYYNGVLFLTTNRLEIVDDAIMSRVTAHIKYDYPDKDDVQKLWKILADNFKMKIGVDVVTKLTKTYKSMSGRDIRNLLKMLTKYNPKAKEIKFDMIQELEMFIPFLQKL